MQYTIREGVSIRRIGDEVFIFDRTASMVHSFNRVGAFIIGLLLDKTDVTDIIEKMRERFEVTEEVARNDVQEFIAQLIEKNILCSDKGN